MSVSVVPAAPPFVEPSRLERDTLFLLTTPERYRDGSKLCRRTTLGLWDVETAMLFCRGESAVAPLRGEGRGAPTLAHIVRVSSGAAMAARAATHQLAMSDWGDERGNLGPEFTLEIFAMSQIGFQFN